jgi:predicted DNA-binding protein (UPF0251 family)
LGRKAVRKHKTYAQVHIENEHARALLGRGMSIKEVAESMGITYDTVQRRLKRAENAKIINVSKSAPPVPEVTGPIPSLADWCEKTPVSLDGENFSFNEHEYLRTPYEDDHPNMVEQKAAQMGLSTKAILKVLHSGIYQNLRGVLYLFPTAKDMGDFCQGRFDPIIADNPDSIANQLTVNDSKSLKTIRRCVLYMRGMQTALSLKSMPIDFIVFDELDEAPEDRVALALKRMSHSKVKRVLKLSNPSIPDYGVNIDWQKSDQRHWLLKCPKCGQYTCLEETFPNCLLKVNGDVIRACGHCQGELNPALGEWVAKKPDIMDIRGYQYSQLFSQFVTPKEIYEEYKTTTNLPVFWNMTIGLPYIEAENRLSTEEVLALCSNEGMLSFEQVSCYMGVDQGKGLHVVIGKSHWQKKGQVVHISQYRDFEELDALMKNFHVVRCVIDSMPETRKAREFAERFPGRVYLNTYNRYHRGPYNWNDENMAVGCNRTESLDASHYTVTRNEIILPRQSDEVKTFADHMHNIGKRLEENKEGNKVYVYRKMGLDHYRHAYNYFVMALQQGIQGCFSDRDLR